jgi:hypothetical protein
MFAIELPWKEFNVSLTDVQTWMLVNAGEFYEGNSADTKLTLWFSEDPGQTISDAVAAYWTAIDEESDEALNYVSAQAIQDAVDTLRAGIPAKDWDDMSTAERKIVLGQMPTKTELGL